MISHCGFENDMKITQGNITQELLCAMRVHLINETEMRVFCPKDVRVWEENCHNVEFLNFTAISMENELAVVRAFENSLHSLLGAYPHTADEDRKILRKKELMKEREGGGEGGEGEEGEGQGEGKIGHIIMSAVRLRLREKEMLQSTLTFLADHELAIMNGTIPFQLELKAQERIEANLREEEHQRFIADVQRRALITTPLAYVEVNMGSDVPKVNLTLREGQSLHNVVEQFCALHHIGEKDVLILESALKKRVQSPPPLDLLLGIITPLGERKILSIPTG